MPLKSALLRDFGGCCFAVTLLKVAFMVIRGDLKSLRSVSFKDCSKSVCTFVVEETK